MFGKHFYLIIIFFWSIGLSGQTYLLDSSTDSTTINTCSGTFYDSGGPSGDYQNFEDYNITFCSDNGDPISFEFISFDLEYNVAIDENYDEFFVYDGPSIVAPQLPNSPFVDLTGEIISSSGTCLTFRFDSDFSQQRDGWAAIIDCVLSCQEIGADFSNSNPSPNPTSDIIQVCENEEIDFAALGLYPENNVDYLQSDVTSSFTWNFGDGQTGSGQNVSHTYASPGAYEVGLLIEDVNGCTNSDELTLIVHVSTTPTFTGTNIMEDEICLGSTNTLQGFVQGASIEPVPCEDVNSPFVEFLDAGVSYDAEITYSCFPDGATINSVDDLLGICLNIEHSYLGELEFEVTCPNGQSILLIEDVEVFGPAPLDLGTPNSGVGVGEDYCFTEINPTYGILNLNDYSVGTMQPSGTYLPTQSLSGLVGCPLNGEWTLTTSIQSTTTLDNGHLFSWDIEFAEYLAPTPMPLNPLIISEEWENDPTITVVNDNEITVLPTEVGQACYTYSVMDDIGCSYDTTLCFNVVESAVSLTIDPINEFCPDDPIYDLSTNIPGGTWTGDVNSDGSFDPSVGEGTYSGIYTVEVGSCILSEDVILTVREAVSGTISGDASICSTSMSLIEIEFIGSAPFTFEFAIDDVGQGEIMTSDNPYTLTVAEEGIYTLLSVSDLYCDGLVSGTAEVSFYDSPSAINITEECSADLTTYTISFDITGGDNTSYQVDGGGTISGSTFTSNAIANGTAYSFMVFDGNNCDQFEVTGNYDCGCAASATISGDVEICDGGSGDLQVSFTGAAPWTFEYLLDGINPTSVTTSDNPYDLSVSESGTYSLQAVTDANCIGSVVGPAEVSFYDSPTVINITEECSTDLTTYMISFDITGGDNASYQVGGGGTITGSTFTSDAIANGTGYSFIVYDGNNCDQFEVSGSYDCGCAASATISGDVEICNGSSGDLQVDFTGAAPWTFEYLLDGINPTSVTTSDNPYDLSVSESGTYSLQAVTDANCLGSILGTAEVSFYDSPTAINIVQDCSTDLTTYTISFDITGGDNASYQIDGGGTISGSTFTSNAIANGTAYSFMVYDGNNCDQFEVTGSYDCGCAASATISADVELCDGASVDLQVNFAGTAPWTFEYLLDGINPTGVTTSDNPYDLSVSESGIYSLQNVTDANCVGSILGTAEVSFYDSPTAINITEECSTDLTTYSISFDIIGGDNTSYQVDEGGTITGSTFTSNAIANGTGYSFMVYDGNNCDQFEVSGSFDCGCAASAAISGDIDICEGSSGDLQVDFTGSAPWTFEYLLDGTNPTSVTTSDNPYDLSVSESGTYSLQNVTDANCLGSILGTAEVSFYDSPSAMNITEQCSADLTTYMISFDITGGDNTSYQVDGGGTITGSTFTSTAIANGTGYSFMVYDGNNCDQFEVTGSYDCGCAASATISGDVEICDGTSGDLQVDFTGSAPWTFEYLVDGINSTSVTTSDNPYGLSVSESGTYSLQNVTDANCIGSVLGTSEVSFYDSPLAINITEECSADLTTYSISFDIIGGDNTSYQVDEGGTITGSTFTSNAIANGTGYSFMVYDGNNCDQFEVSGSFDCGCAASATIGSDIEICDGDSGDLQVSFTGSAPWTFEYLLDGINPISVTTSDNPYNLSVSESGTYSLQNVTDANCIGSILGTAEVSFYDSPTAINITQVCSTDLTTYTISFEISGGDNTSYQVDGGGTVLGSAFTSNAIANGTDYSFMVYDGNNCDQFEVSGSYDCGCAASATISGDVELCDGSSGDLQVDFTGVAPWTFEYLLDGINPTSVTTSDNPYDLSVSESGTYTLQSISDTNCIGSVLGTAEVSFYDSPSAIDITEECSADLTTYMISFDITGGDNTSYQVDGGGTVLGSTFTSTAIANGTGYSFMVYDGNNCDQFEVTGSYDCGCAASATISGDVEICDGTSGDLQVDFTGSAPWTFEYLVDGINSTSVTTSDNPYGLSVSESGTYSLQNVTDANCIGSVLGTSEVSFYDSPLAINITEECSADLTTYSISFDIIGGDNTSYQVDEGGTITGSTFTSNAIANGTGYSFMVYDGNNCDQFEVSGSFDCGCAASATIGSDIEICDGDSGDLQVSFTGSAPWTFEYLLDGINPTSVTTSDNPYNLSVSESGTYSLQNVTDANCIGSILGTAEVSFYDSPTAINITQVCSTDLTTYTISFEISGGDNTSYQVDGGGTVLGSAFTSNAIANGTDYSFMVYDGNNCDQFEVSGSYDCGCAASATISGDVELCDGSSGDLQVDFTGVAPWTFEYLLDGINPTSVTTSDNPYDLSVSESGTYTLQSISDTNCIGSVLGTAEVSFYDSPSAIDITEECSADLTTYMISFDITGGDNTSYQVDGGGTITGSTFTSNAIANGTGYSFMVYDGNNCNQFEVTGSYDCGCAASATISGDVEICDGTSGDLQVDFTGAAPWTFEYLLDGINPTSVTTSDNPYGLIVNESGTYSLQAVTDANCLGSVLGTAEVSFYDSPSAIDITEECSADLTSYTISFDITSGDNTSYQVDGGGIVTGTTFTSNAIANGTGYIFMVYDGNNCDQFEVSGSYDCGCAASATISMDAELCEGSSGDLQVDFTGTSPWTFEYLLDGINPTSVTTSDNPYDLSVSESGTYSLQNVTDANCVGSIFGTAEVSYYDSPTAINIVQECSTDLTTYTISFDIAGGDNTSYQVDGAGTITGSTFTSDAIVNGTAYSFMVYDGNNCDQFEVSGSYDCGCAASATMSGDVEICDGGSGELQVDFTGAAPWTFEYLLDGINPTNVTTSDNPYDLSVSESGTYSLQNVTDANCVGSIFGTAELSFYDTPIAINIVQECSTDLTTYTISFDITGGDNTSYQVDGVGTITGSTFTSNAIANGTNYSFMVYDGNNCDQFQVTGSYDCGCAASATISGDVELCDGSSGDLQVSFTGIAPWTFEYLLDGINPTTVTTSDNPYDLSVSESGTYSLQNVTDANCIGSVLGSSEVNYYDSPSAINIVQDCSTDLTTYMMSFDIIGGDNTSYQVDGGGTITGSTFTSNAIANGTGFSFMVYDGNNCDQFEVTGSYDCGCAASATISDDVEICDGSSGDLQVDFTGTAPWTFEYLLDGINPTSVMTSDNPYDLSVSEFGTYSLQAVTDANCIGSVLGTAEVSFYDSPLAINIVQDCSIGLTTYTISFDIIGGDNTSYQVDGGGTITGSTFTSNAIANGTGYSFMVYDGNNCDQFEVTGSYECGCSASATISGDIEICDGGFVDLQVSFTGAAPWTFEYLLDGINPTSVTTSDNPYNLSVSESGTFSLQNVSDANCIGSVIGTAEVVVHDLPEAVISGNEIICEGTEALFPINLTGNAEWTIIYTINGINQTPIMTNDPNFQLPANQSGEYEIISVSDLTCTNSGEGIASLEFYPPLQATYSEDESACYGDSIGVWVSVSGGVGPPYNYTWISDDILSSSDSSAILLSEVSTNIEVVVTDNCDYSLTVDIPIMINELPTISISGIQTNCGPGNVEIINTTPSSFVGVHCTWTINNETFINCDEIIDYYFEEAGTYDVLLEMESPEGCYNSELFESFLEIHPVPVASFIYDDSMFDVENTEIDFINTSSEDVINNYWQIGNIAGFNDENISFDFPTELGPNTWPVCLSVQNEFGCTDSVCYPLTMKPNFLIYVPNSYTPDNDGLNDYFFPVLSGVEYDAYEFLIYDRVGNLVFETNNIHEKWNGSVFNTRSQYVKDGLYVWYLKVEITRSTEIHEINGTVKIYGN